MEAKELRLGNLVDTPNPHMNPFMIKSIEESKVTGYNNFGSLVYWYMDDIKPIPLTEELLIRFGFGKVIGFFITVGPNISLDVSYNNDKSYPQWYCYIRNINGPGKEDDFALLRKDLQFVHEIQNLYFLLKGKELELKTT